MPFDAMTFLLSRSLIEREGVAPADATRLAVLPTMVGGPMVQSVVLATALGRREAPAAAAPAQEGGATVPEGLVGRSLSAASEVLTDAEIAWNVVLRPVQGTPWEVIATEPEGGSPLAPGTTLELTVSALRKVPEVNGKTVRDAVMALAGVGLVVDVAKGVDSWEDATVQGQSPAARDTVLLGSSVELFVQHEVSTVSS